MGYFRETKIVPLLHLNTGLEYYENGSRENNSNKVRLGYLSLPVSLKLKIGAVHASAGASGALRLFARETTNGDLIDPDRKKYKRMDATAFVGAGAKVLFIGLDIRYHWGLVDVLEGYNNQFLQLGANLYFGK